MFNSLSCLYLAVRKTHSLNSSLQGIQSNLKNDSSNNQLAHLHMTDNPNVEI